jgi:hypothetical protein
MEFVVNVGFDETQRRYFVLSSEVEGLNVEADTFEELVEIARDLAPDLLPKTSGTTLVFETKVSLAA